MADIDTQAIRQTDSANNAPIEWGNFSDSNFIAVIATNDVRAAYWQRELANAVKVMLGEFFEVDI